MRKPILAGNWKMNNNIEESIELVKKLTRQEYPVDRDIVICPPFTALYAVGELIEDTRIKLGAQNIFFENKGAFTGEISPLMLKDLGVEYVIVGHSERRQFFNETDETINLKVKAAQGHDMIPILCVGESLAQREGQIAENIVKQQLLGGLKDISDAMASKLVLAYEPIWAIGTGRTATSQQANEMIAYIRSILSQIFGEDKAQEIRIQYGGSVKPENITDLMKQPDIDGALVGGASLQAEDFQKIINYQENK
ncbi:MAG: triose-phosphate isomerase [Tissierellales bacterium]|nr:triose-phosphate isomerase [Tissierellales bacterium]MBN2826808.1 triose-phosphate isomerase [Tissierellales bacterium]